MATRMGNDKDDRGGIGLTGMATQSSISVSGSSEQKVPSVRKGGRGGGGNRNSGGGPGHSGHSVLSSVSSSSILHLSVLKTTRKINARLILLTELLIGTRPRERKREALSLPLTHHLVIYSPFSFLLPPTRARNSLPTRVAVLPFLFFGAPLLFSPSKPNYSLSRPCRPENAAKRKARENNLRRKSRYLGGGAAIVREP